MMTPISKGLTDEHIELLAKYYATLGAKSAAAPVTAPASNAKCVGCHGPQGEGVGAFPALAGKDAAYLTDQLQNYKTETRQNPMMVPIAKGLTDAEIEELAGYYSTLKPSN